MAVKFTQGLFDAICDRIAAGESARAVLRDADMPSRSTFHRWLDESKELQDQYARAMQIRADDVFDEILEIADNGENDWMKSNREGNDGYIENGEAIQRSRLRVDARKWCLARMSPKKYGEKIDVTSGDKPLEPSRGIDLSALPNDVLAALVSAKDAAQSD